MFCGGGSQFIGRLPWRRRSSGISGTVVRVIAGTGSGSSRSSSSSSGGSQAGGVRCASSSSGACVGKAKSTMLASQAKAFCGSCQLQTVSKAPGVRSMVARAPPGQRMQKEAMHMLSQQRTPKTLAKKKWPSVPPALTWMRFQAPRRTSGLARPMMPAVTRNNGSAATRKRGYWVTMPSWRCQTPTPMPATRNASVNTCSPSALTRPSSGLDWPPSVSVAKKAMRTMPTPTVSVRVSQAKNVSRREGPVRLTPTDGRPLVLRLRVAVADRGRLGVGRAPRRGGAPVRAITPCLRRAATHGHRPRDYSRQQALHPDCANVSASRTTS